MNNIITAQELKTRGSQILEEKTKKDKEAFITVRGETSYVVLTMSKYHYLCDCELEAALKESEADIAAGRFKIMTPEEHIKALKNV